MSKIKNFLFEEMDEKSKNYLRIVKKNQGEGLLGVYVQKTNPQPILYFILSVGLTILFFFYLFDIDPFADFFAQALLRTAFFILPLFFLWSAIRYKNYFSSRSYIGCFIFADSNFIWHCTNFTVSVFDISKSVTIVTKDTETTSEEDTKSWKRDFSVVSNDISYSFDVDNYEKAEEMELFLKAKTISPDFEVAPSLSSRVDDFISPTPTKVSNSNFISLGFIFCLIATMSFLFLIFFKTSKDQKDELVWSSITEIKPSSEKIYWLRIYLLDSNNVIFRDKAQSELSAIYEQKFNEVGLSQIVVQDVSIPDKPNQQIKTEVPVQNLFQGFKTILLPMGKELKMPFINISVNSLNPENPTDSAFKTAITNNLIETFFKTFGDKFFILTSSDDANSPIEVVYSFPDLNNKLKIRYSIRLRLNTESAPFSTSEFDLQLKNNQPESVGKSAIQLAILIIGNQSNSWDLSN